jgi:hypothetical protein
VRGRAGRADLAIGAGGLALSTAYLLAGLALHSVAIEHGRAALARQPNPPPAAVVNAYPTIGTIFVWRVTGETPAGWYVGRTHLLFNGPLEMTFYPNDSGPLVRQALADDRVLIFPHHQHKKPEK